MIVGWTWWIRGEKCDRGLLKISGWSDLDDHLSIICGNAKFLVRI